MIDLDKISYTEVSETLRPQRSKDFSVAFQEDIKGGHQNFDTLIDRNTFSIKKRVPYMTCTVQDVTYLMLEDLQTWVPFDRGYLVLNPTKANEVFTFIVPYHYIVLSVSVSDCTLLKPLTHGSANEKKEIIASGAEGSVITYELARILNPLEAGLEYQGINYSTQLNDFLSEFSEAKEQALSYAQKASTDAETIKNKLFIADEKIVEVNQKLAEAQTVYNSAFSNRDVAIQKAGEASTSADTAKTEADKSIAASQLSVERANSIVGAVTASETAAGIAVENNEESAINLSNVEALASTVSLNKTATDTKAEEARQSALGSAESEGNAKDSETVATTKASEASASQAVAIAQAGIATTKANQATASETVATEKAGQALSSEGIATTKASEASASATLSSTKATASEASATVSTTQAGIATEKAIEADQSATTASTAASIAVTAKTDSETARDIAIENAEQTALDRIATGEDRTATGADRVQTGLDREATGLDVTATGEDRTATGLDRIATGQDRTQTGLDRVQTGLDRTATEQAKDIAVTKASEANDSATDATTQAGIATGAADTAITAQTDAETARDISISNANQTGLDRIQTGEDRVATGQDRVQTGLDVIAANEAKDIAIEKAGEAEASASIAAQVGTSTPLTGFTVGANTPITSADTILSGFEKTQGQLNTKIGGSGTANFLSKFTAAGSVGNSIVFDSGGNVGIGTSSPGQKLEVAGAITTSGALTLHQTSKAVISFNTILSGAEFRSYGPVGTVGKIFFYQGSGGVPPSISMIIDSTGNVGIGTTSPTNTLDINGTVRIRSIANATGDFLTKSATGVVTARTAAEVLGDIGGIGGTIAAGQVAFGTGVGTVGGDSGLVWDNVTKELTVGVTTGSSKIIGILNQDRRIEISAQISSTVYISATINPSPFNVRSLGLKGVDVIFETGASTGNATTEKWRILSNGIFQSKGAQTIQTSGTEALTLQGNGGNTILNPSGGNVGIGTSTPNAKLDLYTNGDQTLRFSHPVIGTFPRTDRIVFGSPELDGGSSAIYGVQTAAGGGLGYLSFYITTSGLSVERMRIDTTGNVGIGTTTPSEKLHVAGRVRIDTRANATGNFATFSATGVVQERTALESSNDILKSIVGYNATVAQRLEHTSAGIINWVNI